MNPDLENLISSFQNIFRPSAYSKSGGMFLKEFSWWQAHKPPSQKGEASGSASLLPWGGTRKMSSGTGSASVECVGLGLIEIRSRFSENYKLST